MYETFVDIPWLSSLTLNFEGEEGDGDVSGGADVGGGGAVEGEPVDVGLPQPPTADEHGAMIARYNAAGIDLANTDPADLARAHAFQTRVGSQRVFTEQEAPGIFQEYLARLAQDPNGRKVLAEMIGQQVSPQVADGEDVDPNLQQLAELKAQLARQEASLQDLQGARRQFASDAQARQVAGRAEGLLKSSMSSVAGASDLRKLERDFWRDLGAGSIRPEQLTQAGIRSWVAQYVKDYGPVQKPQRAAGVSGAKRGSKTKKVKEEELSADDVTDFFAQQMGLG
jgi:hypothetical protein